jgi:hypothetical protein
MHLRDSQGCWTVVDVVELLERPKQTIAQTTMAVTAAAPPITAGFAKNAACCSPAGGPGCRGSAGSAGGGAGAWTVAPPDVLPPEVPAPPLWPAMTATGWTLGCVVSCANEAVSVEAKKTAAVAADKSGLAMANLIPNRPILDKMYHKVERGRADMGAS